MKATSIFKAIRIRNALKLICPCILLALISTLYINLPAHNIFNPTHADSLSKIETLYKDDVDYVNIHVNTLYDSGIKCLRNGKSIGTYYYAFEHDYCYFFLLSNKYLENYAKENNSDTTVINDININAGIIYNHTNLDEIARHISHELNWTYTGIINSTSKYLISEPDYPYVKNIIIVTVFLILCTVTSIYILYSLVCICCPYLYRSIIKLRHYGRIKAQISQANTELRQETFFCISNFIITKSFLFIYTHSDFQIIPLEQIVWAYKFSSYRPTKRSNKKITYTLCIYGKHNVSLISSHHPKPDIDNVLNYLNQNYPDILFGYSREYERIARLRMK